MAADDGRYQKYDGRGPSSRRWDCGHLRAVTVGPPERGLPVEEILAVAQLRAAEPIDVDQPSAKIVAFGDNAADSNTKVSEHVDSPGRPDPSSRFDRRRTHRRILAKLTARELSQPASGIAG